MVMIAVFSFPLNECSPAAYPDGPEAPRRSNTRTPTAPRPEVPELTQNDVSRQSPLQTERPLLSIDLVKMASKACGYRKVTTEHDCSRPYTFLFSHLYQIIKVAPARVRASVAGRPTPCGWISAQTLSDYLTLCQELFFKLSGW